MSEGEQFAEEKLTRSKTKGKKMSETLETLVSLLSTKCSSELGAKGAETALPQFDGESDVNLWFNNFEANAAAYKWTNMQKFVFARNKMVRVAELFLQTVTVTNYAELKKELLAEFSVTYSSAEIHRQLRDKRKRDSETFLEFTLQMRNIGAKADIDELSIIRYIVGGIKGRSEQKIGMYGSKTYNELKRQYEIFEHLTNTNQNQQTKKNLIQTQKPKKICRMQIAECKADGPKCFKCNKMGHIAKYCSIENEKSVALNNVQKNKNMMKEVIINNVPLVPMMCLIDSGAEVSLIRKTFALKWDVHIGNYNNMIAGIGGRVRRVGIVRVDIILDGIKTCQHLVVVPDNAIYVL